MRAGASMDPPKTKGPESACPRGPGVTRVSLERPARPERHLARIDHAGRCAVVDRLGADHEAGDAVLEAGDGAGVERVRDVRVERDAVLVGADPEDLLEPQV